MAVPLFYPLVICIEEAGRQRFDAAAKVFETYITMINKDGSNYKCKLHLGLPEDMKNDYRLVSNSHQF